MRKHIAARKKAFSRVSGTASSAGRPFATRHTPDAETVTYEHATTGAVIKLTDGHKENHKAILDKSPDQSKKLVRWILSQ